MDKVIPTNGTSAEDIKYANTVKKMYIDGVDVSECNFYKDKEHTKSMCKKSQNCYYKQLKRLQAENEQIKKELKDYKISKENSYKNLKKEWQQLQWDIRKLTTENERLKNDLNEAYEHYNFKRIHNEVINAENLKYKQALQEIRKLIKKLDLSLGCAYGDYDCDNCSDINEETVCKIKLQNIILAKINDVIGAE